MIIYLIKYVFSKAVGFDELMKMINDRKHYTNLLIDNTKKRTLKDLFFYCGVLPRRVPLNVIITH